MACCLFRVSGNYVSKVVFVIKLCDLRRDSLIPLTSFCFWIHGNKHNPIPHEELDSHVNLPFLWIPTKQWVM